MFSCFYKRKNNLTALHTAGEWNSNTLPTQGLGPSRSGKTPVTPKGNKD